jgi:hypothetical protein
VNLPRALDLFFPALLLAFVPIDLLIGLSKGLYPTQATLAIIIGGGIGLLMARRLRQPRRPLVVEDGDPEVIANTVINRQLNSGLGAALLGLAFLLTIFGLIMIAVSPARPIPLDRLDIYKLVELGFLLLFNLLVAGLELIAARIYLLGRR